ncbi:hydantoinase B/oxoprolinase family protein, partial [Rhizobiaceae sp. 2RAB30]
MADEMALNLKRASRSVYVKEAADFGTGLVDQAGHIFAMPAATSVGSLDANCEVTLAAVGWLEPGDVILTNDPYRSGGLATHLPDLQIVKPFFCDGKVVAYGWSFVHFMDVGGRVPASISPSNHEVFQEGISLPPCKIMRRGKLNEDVANIFIANCRTPEQNISDVHAMIGAMGAGERRYESLIQRHGLAAVLAAQMAVQDYAAEKTRAVLRQVPDGTYDFWDFMDDDMISGIPTRFRVSMTVAD